MIMGKNNKIYAIRRYLELSEMLNGNKYGDILYVGKTIKSLPARLEQHCNDKSHKVKTDWLAKNRHEIVLLEENLQDWEVADREQYWIQEFGTQFKLNRIRAIAPTYSSKFQDGKDAEARAKARIKQMKKANK